MRNFLTFKSKYFEDVRISFFNKRAILFGSNNSKKSLLLSEISKALTVKINRNLNFDALDSNNREFQVVHLKEVFELSQELKFSKTSNLKEKILRYCNKKIYDEKQFSDFGQQLENISKEIATAVESYFFESHSLDSLIGDLDFKAEIMLNSVELILEKLLKLNIYTEDNKNLEEKNYSKFLIRMLLLKIILGDLDFNDKLRPIFILLDLPTSCADDLNTVKFVNWTEKFFNENIYWIFTLNDSNSLRLMYPNLQSINFVDKNNIISVINYHKYVKNLIVFSTYIKSKYNDFDLYRMDLNKILNEDDIVKEGEKFKRVFEWILYSMFLYKNIVLNENEDDNFFWEVNDNQQLVFYLNAGNIALIVSMILDLGLSLKVTFNLKTTKLKNLIETIY